MDTHTHTVHDLIPIQVYVANIEDSMARSSRVFLVIGLVFVYTLGSFKALRYDDVSLVIVGILTLYEIMVLFIGDTCTP